MTRRDPPIDERTPGSLSAGRALGTRPSPRERELGVRPVVLPISHELVALGLTAAWNE
jgi:hypothetical protein